MASCDRRHQREDGVRIISLKGEDRVVRGPQRATMHRAERLSVDRCPLRCVLRVAVASEHKNVNWAGI